MPSCLVSPEARRVACSARRSVVARRRERGVECLLVLARVVVGARDRGARERVGLHEVDAGGSRPGRCRSCRPPRRAHARSAAWPRDDRRRGRRRRWCCWSAPSWRRSAPSGSRRRRPTSSASASAGSRRSPGRRRPAAMTSAVEADDLAVVVDTEPCGHDVVAAVHERHHVLGSALDPLHRLAECERRLGGDQVLDVAGGLRSETATDPRADDLAVVRARDRASARRRRGSSAAPGATATS